MLKSLTVNLNDIGLRMVYDMLVSDSTLPKPNKPEVKKSLAKAQRRQDYCIEQRAESMAKKNKCYALYAMHSAIFLCELCGFA